MAIISSLLPLTVRVNKDPRLSHFTMSSCFNSRFSSSLEEKTHWIFWMLHFISSRSFDKSTPPWCKSPTWSQISSNSRRLWEAITGVNCRSCISFAKMLLTLWRITGSSPSKVSSHRRYSVFALSPSRIASCFFIPLEKVLILRLDSSPKLFKYK